MSFGDWVDAEAWSLDSDPWGPLAETHSAGLTLGMSGIPSAAVAGTLTSGITLGLAATPAIGSNDVFGISFSLSQSEAISVAAADVMAMQIVLGVDVVAAPQVWARGIAETTSIWTEDSNQSGTWVEDGAPSGTWT